MNAAFDPYDPALALWQQLGPADQCRFIDQCISQMGAFAPIPQFEDDKDDCRWWLEQQPHARTAIMWTMITDRLSSAQLQAAREYITKRETEASDG